MTERTREEARVHEGLAGVLVTETKLSHVDGEAGRLIIAGHDVEELARTQRFEGACAALFAAAGEPVSEQELTRALDVGRREAFARLDRLGDALTQRDAMDALRGAIAQLPDSATREQVIAAMAVYAAAWARLSRGRAPIAPPEGATHAEALLAMLGIATDPARVRALDAYLVTVIDHGLNASTFAARVVASTESDLVSSVVAGIGALKGPLHGGAPGPVLTMLDAIGEPSRARAHLEAELRRGSRIMGMGHRIYRQRDPRAFVLERAIEALERELGVQEHGEAEEHGDDARARGRLELARAVEREAESLLKAAYPERNLRANVEFYTAVLLSALGLPAPLFSAIFAVSRCAGWSAHVAEQRKKGRLIRPSARYVGELPNRSEAF